MADAAAAAFGRRVSTTDYVSLVGRTSLTGAAAVSSEAQPLIETDDREGATAVKGLGVTAELRILLSLALPVVCTAGVDVCGPVMCTATRRTVPDHVRRFTRRLRPSRWS
jgi:hypothetical protein